LAGIKAGEEASRKLHADAKVQSENQTVLAIAQLKDKFDATKAQVSAIVSNFAKIQTDLQELKNEYL
jgi:chromosome segregation ATPase